MASSQTWHLSASLIESFGKSNISMFQEKLTYAHLRKCPACRKKLAEQTGWVLSEFEPLDWDSFLRDQQPEFVEAEFDKESVQGRLGNPSAV